MSISRKPSFLKGLDAVDSLLTLSPPTSPSENQGPQHNQKVDVVATKILNPLHTQPLDRAPTPLQSPVEYLQKPKVTRSERGITPDVPVECKPFSRGPSLSFKAMKEKLRFDHMMENNPYRKLPLSEEFHPGSSRIYLPGTIGYRCIKALTSGKPLP